MPDSTPTTTNPIILETQPSEPQTTLPAIETLTIKTDSPANPTLTLFGEPLPLETILHLHRSLTHIYTRISAALHGPRPSQPALWSADVRADPSPLIDTLRESGRSTYSNFLITAPLRAIATRRGMPTGEKTAQNPRGAQPFRDLRLAWRLVELEGEIGDSGSKLGYALKKAYERTLGVVERLGRGCADVLAEYEEEEEERKLESSRESGGEKDAGKKEEESAGTETAGTESAEEDKTAEESARTPESYSPVSPGRRVMQLHQPRD